MNKQEGQGRVGIKVLCVFFTDAARYFSDGGERLQLPSGRDGGKRAEDRVV